MSALGILLIALAYLLGSIMGALLVNRMMDLTDPRQAGSKNPGTSNMLRTNGKWPAVWTLAIDIGKGMLPVGLAIMLDQNELTISLVAIAACVGHMLPLFYGFRGGKGVATTLGVVTLLSGQLASGLVGIWIVAFGLSRYASVASLLCAISSPFIAFYLVPEYAVTVSVLALMILVKHRANIQNLLQGAELRFPNHK